MMLFLAFLSSIFERASVANSKSFSRLISQNPFSLVLFQTKKCSSCQQILQIFDQITDKYTGKISMIVVDIDVSKDIAEKYSVKEIPSIGLFSNDVFLQFYKNEWIQSKLIELCDSLLSQNPDTLADIFDVYEYQQNQYPANLIIFDPNSIEIAESIQKNFFGRLHVAILKNRSISDYINKENGIGQISRPSDRYCEIIDHVDFDYLATVISPLIVKIENQESFGHSQANQTLVAFIDERDPLQMYEIQNLFWNLSKKYENLIGYQYCDFYRCINAALKLGIENYGNPIYVLTSETESQTHLYADPSPTSDEMIDWIDQTLNPNNNQTEDAEIQEIYARNFMQIALDPRTDVILLMIVPGMSKSKEAYDNFLNLMNIFRPFKKHIKFYKFNPKIQRVPGLQIPIRDIPLISIWAQEGGANGATFSAVAPFPSLVENIMKLIKTKISPAHNRDIANRAQQIYQTQKEKSDEL